MEIKSVLLKLIENMKVRGWGYSCKFMMVNAAESFTSATHWRKLTQDRVERPSLGTTMEVSDDPLQLHSAHSCQRGSRRYCSDFRFFGKQ